MCLVTRDMAVTTGLMSWRGQPMPQRTASSRLPPQLSGMPVPSPKNSMSNSPRSAMRAISS